MYLKGGENMNTVNFMFQQSNIPDVKGKKLSHDFNQHSKSFEKSLQENQQKNQLSSQENMKENDLTTRKLNADQMIQGFLINITEPSENDNTSFFAIEEQLKELKIQAESLLEAISTEEDIDDIATELLRLLEEWTNLTSRDSQNNESSTEQVEDLVFYDEMIELLENEEALLNNGEQPLENTEKYIENLLNWLNESPMNLLGGDSALKDLKTQLNHILNQQYSHEEKITQLTSVLKQLVEESLNKEKQQHNTSEKYIEKESSKEGRVWKELVQTYQKRKNFESTYRVNANVERSDVTKWLRNALNTQEIASQNVINYQKVDIATIPMSKVEQYYIHVNSTQNTNSVDQQVIDQFEKIMNSSRFLSQPNGRMQLSIMLRPDHLGEMRINFTQIDGEMVVKIAVHSGATKDLLERNLQQLRHMFSPHQVVIERQEMTPGQSTDVQEEQQEESFNDQESHAQERENNQEQDDSSDIDFREVLMNEKV